MHSRLDTSKAKDFQLIAENDLWDNNSNNMSIDDFAHVDLFVDLSLLDIC